MSDLPFVQSTVEALFYDQRLAVLSTRSADGHPYASLVCVVAEADLSGIYFATSRHTRKFANLTAEPRVAVLVENSQNRQSDIHEAMAVTAVGAVREMEGHNADAAVALYNARHPQLKTFAALPSTAMIRMAVKTYYLVNRFQKVTEYHVG